MTTHASLTKDIRRPCGMPESTCPGELIDVRADGKPSRRPVIYHDAAQAGEGEPGGDVRVRLRMCTDCGGTLVTTKDQQGREYLRNAWAPKVAAVA